MKAESNVKPQLVERYPCLVRINYDVQEEQREDMDGTKSTVYVYRMLELPSVNMSVDELTATLIADKYDKATLSAWNHHCLMSRLRSWQR